MQEGISGKIANLFINSKLTVLLMVALMIIGVYSSFLIPREEEPQIIVPMADIMIGYPGASPKEIENRVVKPLEKIVSNIKGVEHVHSMSMNGQAVLIIQFFVGEDVERSYVKLYDELMKHQGMFPEGVYPPIVKTRSIDDVPMLGLTLWSENYSDFQLRQIAEELTSEIEKVNDVSITKEIGGRTRQLKITLDKDKLISMLWASCKLFKPVIVVLSLVNSFRMIKNTCSLRVSFFLRLKMLKDWWLGSIRTFLFI
jgi:multidrug efflux pump subunit AcrB